MADNVAITAGAGTTVAADEVVDGTLGTVKVQYVKLMDGALDSSVKVGAGNVSGVGAVRTAGVSYTHSSGTITTGTSTVTTGDISLSGNITVYIYGTYAGVNVSFEISPDNTNWFPVSVVREDSVIAETTSGVLTANTLRAWTTGAPGLSYFRVRATAWTSGTANVVIVAGTYPFEPNVAATVTGQAATTSAVTNVGASATNVTLKAANANRKALYVFNAGTNNLFVKLGATATTTTSFTAMIPPNGFWELPDDPIYTGIVDGIWSATGGSGANVTELTA